MSTEDRGNRYIRVFTNGKLLADIEEAILKAINGGARVLVRTTNDPDGLNRGASAITEWAEGLAKEHGLEWQRVGGDVIFTTVR